MLPPFNQAPSSGQPEVLGGVKPSRMIWGATILTLGSLFICWYTTPVENPTIMDSALEYPYTIIFRVGMLYSMFIYFLEFLFIKWWIDSSQLGSHTNKLVAMGTIGLLGYALFVSCIDRKQINYQYAKNGVFVAAVFISLAIYQTMLELKRIKNLSPMFIGETSYLLKEMACIFQVIGIFFGILIYTGEMDIQHKNLVEYEVLISSIVFLWTFVFDFKNFRMDVDRLTARGQGRQQVGVPVVLNKVERTSRNLQHQPQYQQQQQRMYEQQYPRQEQPQPQQQQEYYYQEERRRHPHHLQTQQSQQIMMTDLSEHNRNVRNMKSATQNNHNNHINHINNNNNHLKYPML